MPEKKGLPPLAYVGIGCLVLAIVGLIAISMLVAMCNAKVKDFADNPEKLAATMAELAIKNDPDLEFVKSDDQARTITYRDKKSGKETTITWDKAKDGKFTVTSGDQTTTVDGKTGKTTIETPEGTSTYETGGGLEKFPKWIDVPPAVTGWKGAMHTEKSDGTFRGSASGQSKKSPAELAPLFEKALEAAGFTKQSKTEEQDRAILYYEDKGKKRTLSVTIWKRAPESLVQMVYAQK